MKQGTFRHWLNEKWYEHKEECAVWHTAPCGDVKEYFNKYKYWLKREYRHHQAKELKAQQKGADIWHPKVLNSING